MKHLAEYAKYLLFEAKKDDEIDPKIMKALLKLAGSEKLEDYVNNLNDMLKDNDAKQILIKAFGNADHGYKFDGKIENIPVKDLHPTQLEIDINKSLGWPFKDVEKAKINGENYWSGKPINMPFPLVTFDGKYILDGHHRWSQVYCFNPDAEMVCLNITVASDSDVKDVKPMDALKICQGVLAAKRAETGGQLHSEKAEEGANVFTKNEKDIKKDVTGFTQKDNGEPAKELIKHNDKLNSIDDLVTLLTNNLLQLKKDNKKYADAAKAAGNGRGVMPQTDTGGDDPKDSESAKPDKKGSALNKMIKGTISDKALSTDKLKK